jgi:hypothetical protein
VHVEGATCAASRGRVAANGVASSHTSTRGAAKQRGQRMKHRCKALHYVGVSITREASKTKYQKRAAKICKLFTGITVQRPLRMGARAMLYRTCRSGAKSTIVLEGGRRSGKSRDTREHVEAGSTTDGNQSPITTAMTASSRAGARKSTGRCKKGPSCLRFTAAWLAAALTRGLG